MDSNKKDQLSGASNSNKDDAKPSSIIHASPSNSVESIDLNRSSIPSSPARKSDAICDIPPNSDDLQSDGTSSLSNTNSDVSISFMEMNDLIDHHPQPGTYELMNVGIGGRNMPIIPLPLSYYNPFFLFFGLPVIPPLPPLPLSFSIQLMVNRAMPFLFQRLNPSNNSINPGSSGNVNLIDELLEIAKSIESNNPSATYAILARLNVQPMPLSQNPLQRAALCFKNALEALLLGQIERVTFSSVNEAVPRIHATMTFSNMSPTITFGNMITSQAILESVNSAAMIHIIDFDFGFGEQWSSFMSGIALRHQLGRCLLPLIIRITAVVGEETKETQVAKDILLNLANSCNLRLKVEFVSIASLKTYALGGILVINSEATSVRFSPATFRLINGTEFIMFLMRLAPKVAIFEDHECGFDTTPPSFSRDIAEGIQYFGALIESLDAMVGAPLILSNNEEMRNVEQLFVQARVFQCVGIAGQYRLPWQDFFNNAGMVPMPFSEANEEHAESLLQQIAVPGFSLAKQLGMMKLRWNTKELVSISCWRFA
ncbi:scarecrow-like protein 15 [Aristolochia californica]|uniref:scarecrow-like protein 15 n=1 Tax=Aristolochia californica TaxID=171875 RepID=UPI0035D5A952